MTTITVSSTVVVMITMPIVITIATIIMIKMNNTFRRNLSAIDSIKQMNNSKYVLFIIYLFIDMIY